MRVTLSEAMPFTTAATPSPAAGAGRLLIRLIDAGKGSSGVYPPETLQAAAEARVFPAGTHMYADHPTESEQWDRPERSIRDLAAVLVEDARWDADAQALVAEARVYAGWRQPISDMAEDIGVSIRATAESEAGQWEGKPATVITRIVEGLSVDFVTHAGRGGKVLQILESARARLSEATANDRNEQLSVLVKDAYAGEKTWVWVRDFDDTTVWFSVETPEDMGIYAQAYDVTDDVATALSGERTEVRVQTTYVPVSPAAGATSDPTSPAGQSTATESQEDTMAMTQIEESRLAQLETDAGRATALESERTAAIERAETAERELAAIKTRESLRPVIASVVDASESIPATVKAKVIDQVTSALPVDATKESATTAAEAARTAAEADAAAVAEMLGVGSVRGLGSGVQPTGGDLSEAELDAELAKITGRTVKEA